jgi:hypothetical protein
MRPDELTVLPTLTMEARLSRMEDAVAALAACMGIDADALFDRGEEAVEGNAIERVESMVVDLSEAVRLQAMWVREGEQAGVFSQTYTERARVRAELTDTVAHLQQVERGASTAPVPEVRAALEQRAVHLREKIYTLHARLDRLVGTGGQEK